MSEERRGLAVSNLPTTLGGRDGMKKASINLQDLRREIYLKGKADSAGTGGVEVSCIGLESAASLIGRINLWVKLTGKRNAVNPHVAFDEAGAGDVLGRLSGAPVLDPTQLS